MSQVILKFPDHIENAFCDSSNRKFLPDQDRKVTVDTEVIRLQEFLSAGFVPYVAPVVEPAVADDAAAPAEGAAA